MCCFFVLPAIFVVVAWTRFVGSLERTLDRCAPHNRDILPGLVWLLFVPAFNLGWWFRSVMAVSRSLRSEFEERDMARTGYGTKVGVACGAIVILSSLALGSASLILDPLMNGSLALVGMVAAIAAFCLWAVYWGTISNCKDELHDDDRRRDRDQFDRTDEPPPRRDDRGQIEDRFR